MAAPESFVAHGAQNATSIAPSGLAAALMSQPFFTTAATLFFISLIGYLLSPRLDPREPPPLKARVPFVGHMIGMIKEGINFLTVLSLRRMPIATLPILNGKMYAIWDSALIQSAYRNKNLSFIPFVLEFARRELRYDDACDKIVKESGLMGEFFDAVHVGMSSANTHRMNVNALKYVTKKLDTLGTEEEVPNLYVWTRDLMTMATCEALYGSKNPMREQPELLEDLWTFEGQLTMLLIDVFPSITARAGHGARARLQTALGEYYSTYADRDDDAAGITNCRAEVLRKFGIPHSQVGIFELALLHVATANTIPTLFWFISYIITRPELVDRLRKEALSVAEHNANGDVTVNVAHLADKCPLLVSCYREAIRMNNKAIGNRRVIADTTISDGKGNTYLLKEGINIQMASEPLHQLQEVWGEDVAEFNAERFIDQGKGVVIDKLEADAAKAKRASYIPFGGGRHLCPGRNFAFAENLGFMVSFILGFEVAPMDGDWEAFKDPIRGQCAIASAVSKPKNGGEGFGMRLRRREGWETKKWTFTSEN